MPIAAVNRLLANVAISRGGRHLRAISGAHRVLAPMQTFSTPPSRNPHRAAEAPMPAARPEPQPPAAPPPERPTRSQAPCTVKPGKIPA